MKIPEELLTIGKYALYLVSFNLVSVGAVGALVVLRDSVVKGKFVLAYLLGYSTSLILGILIFKELIK